MNIAGQQVVDPGKALRTVLGDLVSEFSVRNRGAALANVHSVTNSEGFVPSTDYFKKEVFSKDLSTYKIVRRGMLAYNPSRINVGSVAVQNRAEEVVVSPLYVVVSVDGTRLHPDYLSAFLHSPGALAQIRALTSGSVRDTLSFRSFAKLRLPVPSLEEQEAALHRLAGVRRLRDLREQQLLCLDNLAKSLFVEMFGDPVENPMRWATKSLPEIGIMERGVSKARPRNAPELLGGPYPLIQTGDVAHAQTFIEKYNTTYSKAGLAQSRMWPKGTLCITIAANIAETAILQFDACFPDSIVGFIANSTSNIRFIHIWFQFFQSILEKQAPMSAQKNINLKTLASLEVIVPPIVLQRSFAERVEAIDKSKFAIRKSLDELNRLYRSLLQQYFG